MARMKEDILLLSCTCQSLQRKAKTVAKTSILCFMGKQNYSQQVTRYVPIELMLGQKPIMLVEDLVPTWVFLDWKDGITRERLLELWIQQLEKLLEDQKIALKKLMVARLSNKDRFDRTHRLKTMGI